MKKALISSILAGAGMLGVASAQAVVAYGPVEQYYSNGSSTYVYVRPANFLGVPAYVWYCYTTDAKLSDAITSSLHKNVYIVCSNSSWPSSGSYRYGGTLSYLYTN